MLGERLFVMAPRPGRIHREYQLPFAEMGLQESLPEIKQKPEFSTIREEILDHDLGHGRGDHGRCLSGSQIIVHPSRWS